jgi:hypothetical protein
MNIYKYFDLDLMPDEAVLGPKTKSEKTKHNRNRFLVTLLMYVFVWLGILGQKVLSLYQEGLPISWENIGQGFTLVALVVATAIFPSVFPKVFVKISTKSKKSGAGGWFFVQLCVAFQQGFFWQALLGLLIPK